MPARQKRCSRIPITHILILAHKKENGLLKAARPYRKSTPYTDDNQDYITMLGDVQILA